jgi:hypothetical protein
MLNPSLRPSLNPSLRPSIGGTGATPLLQRIYGAIPFAPDTIGSVGGSRVSPYSGAVVAATDPITRPLTIGAVQTMMWLCQAGATNDIVQSTAYDTAAWTKVGTTVVAANGPSGSADAFEMTQGSGVLDGVTATNYAITANTVRLIAFEVKAVSGANWLRIASRNSGNINGTDAWFDLSAGVSGNHTVSGTGTPISLNVSRLGADWWTVRVALTYDASSTLVRTLCMLVTANGSSTRAAGVYRLRHCTCTATAVPVSSIPTAGATASITADNICRAALDVITAGMGAVSLLWWVQMEGHSIGAAGHASGVQARMWDVNTSRYGAYTVANRQAIGVAADNAGSQSAVSATGAAPDASGGLVGYVMTFTPSVALRLYRNGVLIAEDTTVGDTLNPWVNSLFFGNLLALNRALSGWVSPLFRVNRALTAAEIAAIPVGSAP